jgi:hypothetical protein
MLTLSSGFCILAIVSFIVYFIGVFVERNLNKAKNATPAPHYAKSIIKDSHLVLPIEVKFEHMWDVADEKFHRLTPEEAAHQRRRIIATKASDWFFVNLMREDSKIADTVIERHRLPGDDKVITVTTIRILPAQKD